MILDNRIFSGNCKRKYWFRYLLQIHIKIVLPQTWVFFLRRISPKTALPSERNIWYLLCFGKVHKLDDCICSVVYRDALWRSKLEIYREVNLYLKSFWTFYLDPLYLVTLEKHKINFIQCPVVIMIKDLWNRTMKHYTISD